MKWSFLILSWLVLVRALSRYRAAIERHVGWIEKLDWSVLGVHSTLNLEAGGRNWTFVLQQFPMETGNAEIKALKGHSVDNHKVKGWARFVVASEIEIGVRGFFAHEGEIFHLGHMADSRNLSIFTIHPISMPMVRSLAGDKSEKFLFNSERTNFTDDLTGCQRQLSANIGIIADCNFLRNFETLIEARLYIADIVNKASRLFEDAFNITLVLKELVVPANGSNCPLEGGEAWNRLCTISKIRGQDALNERLNAAAQFRANRGNDGFAVWTMLTHCVGDDVVGLSWQGQVCETGAKMAGVNVVDHTQLDFQVIAHETGHSFGAIHDCTSDSCLSDSNVTCCPLNQYSCNADADYIMNPESLSGQNEFSMCSRGRVCSGIEDRNINTTCLQKYSCPCPSGPCCDNCHYAKSGTLCRRSSSLCEKDAYCSGDSELCPANPLKADGTVCGDSMHCARGLCTSRDSQCKSFLNDSRTSDCASSDSCALRCFRSSDHFCESYNRYYFDGTSCKNGGTCENGKCAVPELDKSFIGIIAAAATISGIAAIVLILFCYIYRCFPSYPSLAVPLSAPEVLSRGENARYVGNTDFIYRPPPPPPPPTALHASRTWYGSYEPCTEDSERRYSYIDSKPGQI